MPTCIVYNQGIHGSPDAWRVQGGSGHSPHDGLVFPSSGTIVLAGGSLSTRGVAVSKGRKNTPGMDQYAKDDGRSARSQALGLISSKPEI